MAYNLLMPLKIKDAAEFQRMLDALADDLVDANIHLRLYRDLNAAVEEYVAEFNESNTFWFLTFRAHIDAAVTRLCRSYDTHDSALNLGNLLEVIEENLVWFDEPSFRERMKGNAFVDSLAASPRRPDAVQLEKDRVDVRPATNPLVKTLLLWRNNAYAHRSRDHALGGRAFSERYPLVIADIETLATSGIRILNRYTSLFGASVNSTAMVGRNDYLTLLKAVRQRRAAWEAEFQEEYARAELLNRHEK